MTNAKELPRVRMASAAPSVPNVRPALEAAAAEFCESMEDGRPCPRCVAYFAAVAKIFIGALPPGKYSASDLIRQINHTYLD